MKITKKTVILILFTAVLLVSAPIVATVFAQTSGPGIGKERVYAKPIVEPVLMGHGFALDTFISPIT